MIRFFFLNFLLFFYNSHCSLQRASTTSQALSLQELEPESSNNVIENQVQREFCQYTDFRWTSCICEKGIMVGGRRLVDKSMEDCVPAIKIIELPCDKSSCDQKLLSTSEGVACPSLFNIDGVCNPDKDFLADVMAKSFDSCRVFCEVMVDCTFFVLDENNNRCKLYKGNRICGKDAPGIITGLAGFDSNPCTDCKVGTWGSLSECIEAKNVDKNNPECGQATRERVTKGVTGIECPYKIETWTCSLPGRTCNMKTELSDIYLKSEKDDGDDESDFESYRMLEISLIFAGIVTGILIFVPTSLIFPKIGIFFFGKKLHCLLSGSELNYTSNTDEVNTENIEDDYDEWEDDGNIEYETEFTLDNR
ncbi:CpTSP6 extracellular membrane-associated protein with a signal peptide [Cryptosporidium ryanae]|uniref:CpTSP6 extracellular membrane-associated protein with a signal peptide n=1 Tax=Cryptosporidium ryanae TaxID=515981 RepID=UPI00351A907F|nr:CpTSP6 extracellular membrane-associated protein with a signal peptide [Cryptosporidium ryanae]